MFRVMDVQYWKCVLPGNDRFLSPYKYGVVRFCIKSAIETWMTDGGHTVVEVPY